MASNVSLNYYKEQMFGEFLAMDGLEEIAVNRPNQLFTKIRGEWKQHDVPLSLDQCHAFSTALANFHGDHIDDTSPILSATLESGERGQIILPPACERNTVSITIRKPTDIQIPHQTYIDSGFYNRVSGLETIENNDAELLRLYNSGNIPLFMEKCIEYGKNMLICGDTGSGKTTYLKTMIGYIPIYQRIITIEDNPETVFHRHKNYVHLFYPADAEEGAIVTPVRLVRACYRMNGDRILLTEIRGAEAWDSLKIIGSGTKGFFSSIHAGTPEEAIYGLIDRCYENPHCSNMPMQALLRKALNCIDVIASIDVNGNVRRMGDIYFKPVHRAKFMEDFRNVA